MLTSRITDIKVSNTSFGFFGGVLLFVAVAPVLLAVALLTPWAASVPAPLAPTTAAIGNAFLTRWLLPFEVASMVLLATLVGAVVIARKEIKAD
jgi:NADH-quinone oxidoreductase subunit J